MRRISGLVLAAALLLPVSFARAAEVTQLYTNNYFADAVSTDPSTGATIGIFVARQKGKGAPVDGVTLMVTGPTGFAILTGTLPKNAFHVSAKAASLEVDIADLTNVFNLGFPASGTVSVDWHAGDVTRESGGTKFEMGTTTVNIVGTSTGATAAVTGEFFGTDLIAPTGNLNLAHTSVIIHVSHE